MNENKRLIKNTGIIAIGSLSTKVLSFVLLPLYTALLSKEEFGTVDYIVSISTFCIPFVSFLMDEAVFRFLIDCKTDEEKSRTISSSFLLVLLGNIAFILIGTPIMLLIKYKYTVYMLFYVCTAVLSQIISALIRGIGQTSKYVVYNFGVSAVTLLLNVFFIAVLRVGLVGMLLSSIIAHILMPLVYVFVLKLWKYVDLKSVNKEQIKSMVKYSVPLIPNKISWSIINLSDRLMIMNMIGSGASGLYAAAYKFPNLVDTVYGFFYQSWKESSARALNTEDIGEFYNYVYKYLKNFMYAFIVCLTAFMPIIFNILINSSYNEAIIYIPPLVLATYFANISGFYGGIFTAYKDTKIMGTTTIVAAIINFGINILCLKKFGLYAAAYSTLISNLAVYLYRRIKTKKYVALNENFLESAAAIGVLGVVWLMFYIEKGPAGYIIQFAVALIYSVLINRKLLSQIINMLKNKKRG